MKKERNKQVNREDSFKIFLTSRSRRSNLFQTGELRFFFSILVAISISFTLFFLPDFETEGYDQKHPKSYTDFFRSVFAEEINGTENADNITGTINQDTIKGLGGNDTLYGGEAGDDVSGGNGSDVIYGGDGRDFLRGKTGDDHLDGGKGNDRLFGDKGNDVLVGGSGNDTLIGGPGQDKFICNNGRDTTIDFNQTEGDVIPNKDCEIINNSNKSESKVTNTLDQQKTSELKNQNADLVAKQGSREEQDNGTEDPSSNIFGFLK
jgi:Ca2+-binding RTX toxin-like protein